MHGLVAAGPDVHPRNAGEPARVRGALRIAVLSYNLPRPGFKRGGIERVAHDLADGLARRGHRVTVHTHDPRPPGAAYEVAPLPWARFVSTWIGRRVTMGYLGHVLAPLTDVGRADVVIAHGDSLLIPLRGRPVIRIMHGSALDEARTATSLGRRILQTGVYGLELLTTRVQQHCVAVSVNTQRRMPRIRHVIPNGVDLGRFHPDPRERAGRPTILFVGALAGRKRGEWLLQQFADRIRPRCPGAELHMVSEPGRSLDGVVYHPGVDDRAMPYLYRRAWVLAVPSTYEGFGLPYVEAMACGTPVVATPNAGSIEVLQNGACGRLPADEAFSDCIVDLLCSEDRRRSLEEVGLRRAEELSLTRTVDAYERLLFSVTAHT